MIITSRVCTSCIFCSAAIGFTISRPYVTLEFKYMGNTGVLANCNRIPGEE